MVLWLFWATIAFLELFNDINGLTLTKSTPVGLQLQLFGLQRTFTSHVQLLALNFSLKLCRLSTWCWVSEAHGQSYRSPCPDFSREFSHNRAWCRGIWPSAGWSTTRRKPRTSSGFIIKLIVGSSIKYHNSVDKKVEAGGFSFIQLRQTITRSST